LFFLVKGWCPKTNILTPDNMYKYSSPAAPTSDFSRAYEDMRGENLQLEPYIINAFFNNLICVSEVRVQRTAPARNTSNVAKIEIHYKTSNGTDVKNSDGTTLVLQSPDDNPTINEESLRCNIQGIIVKILNTTDQKPPSFVRLMVEGCYGPSKSFLFNNKRISFLLNIFSPNTIAFRWCHNSDISYTSFS
jgi:hypothetical protein